MKYNETEAILKQVGKRIRECRQLNDMTQADLAAALSKSIKAVQRYESGETDLPLSHLITIAKTLDISLDYLTGCSNTRTQDPKIKGICNKTGLTEKSVLMLARLKKDSSSRLRIINLLLEQADSDIEDDYELGGVYDGSVLNAVCRYLEQIADDTLSKNSRLRLIDLLLKQADRNIYESKVIDNLCRYLVRTSNENTLSETILSLINQLILIQITEALHELGYQI